MSRTIDELLQSAISLHEEHAPDVVSVDDAIAEAVELLRPQIDQKQIELSVPAHSPAVRGDGRKLREVFYNLLSNAIKYNDKVHGKITINVTTDKSDCTISFCDNGMGIPRDELARVFVPFRRVAAHRDIPGSGLGLYFAKMLVEQQGGRIWAESEPGRGCCFRVQLTLASPSESK